ncbi:MAG: UvrD-helicase domain-containing protein [Sphaerochaetaceae bacterium]|jgi:ATP-dependent exoDNAse (exonuclease V) beta subunit|nr:UvrD-helicase domain-containing protein [Sphaerochaetaceae bacterium]
MTVHDTFQKMIKKLNDSRQQEAIYCDTNCVVTAGAGSGKTTVLSYRFLRLVVEEKAHVDEILTLTFSRLAAAEMHHRIHTQLLAFSDDRKINDELKHFSEATISTIDAFCNRIVASDPTRYGVKVDFIMDEESNREMAGECTRALFDELKGDPGLDALAVFYHPDDLIDKFFVGIASHHFHPSSSFDGSQMAVLVEQQISAIYQQNIDRVLEAFEIIKTIEGTGKQLASNHESAHHLLEQRDYVEAPSDYSVALAILETIITRKCTSTKDFAAICNEQVEIVREALPLALAACAALSEQKTIGEIYAVLDLYFQRYLERKRATGILTFGDVAHMARDILIHNDEVRRYYQRKFRYIMIDEFQDTNQLQKDLVYLLAQHPQSIQEGIPEAKELQKDKLFFVGDEKQSIYRFRGADVRVFKTLGQEIVAAGGRLIVLNCNYRSEPALVSFFNTVFEKIMGDSQQLYEANFESLESREANVGIQPRIELLFKELEASETDDELGTAAQAEGYALAQLIKRMTETDDYLIGERGKVGRRPNFEDIAILFRTGSNQLHYEKALRIAGIPYTLSAVQSLFLEAPANDIYQMLQLLIYPEDRLAFAATLRSPFCRLSDDALLTVLDNKDPEAFGNLSLYAIGADEQEKYNSCKQLFQRLSVKAQTESIASLISFLWHEGGYRYHLLRDPLYQVYLEHFDFLHELALRFDFRQQGLPEFLDYLRPRLGQKEKLDDVEPLRASSHGVQIMTVHKSKGLEFPIVILANMGSSSLSAQTPPWHEVEQEGDPLLVPTHMRPYKSVKNVLYEKDKLTLQAMETAEMKRLFYVALTRAETHLILSGCENTKNLGESAVDKNFLALFLHTTQALEAPQVLGDNFSLHAIEEILATELHTHVSQHKLNNTTNLMELAYANPIPSRVALSSSFSVTQLVQAAESIIEAGHILRLPPIPADSIINEYSLATLFGTWCHNLLQDSIQKIIEAEIPIISLQDSRDCMPKEFLRYPITKKNLAIIGESVLLLVQNFLSSELLHLLLNDHPLGIESEVGFAYRAKVADNERAVIHGSIDLLVRYSDKIRIIDFKTDAFLAPEQHTLQLTMYRKAMQRLYDLPVQATLVYLRDVTQIEWLS